MQIEDRNLVSQTIFWISWYSECAKFIDNVVKTRIKHKRLWEKIILNEEFIEN